MTVQINGSTGIDQVGPKVTKGVTDGTNVSTGYVGEYVESILPSASATSLTTGSAKTITSISLSPGDWDVSGVISFVPAATTNVTQQITTLSLVNNATDVTNGRAARISFAAGVPVNETAIATKTCRFSLTSTTTIYLVSNQLFTVSTMTAYGMISARRAA